MIVEITKNNIKDYANDLLLEGVVETNFNNNPYCKYIAYIDKELVGYIHYWLIFDRLEIDYIFVKGVIEVKSEKIQEENNEVGFFLSDHNPVIVVLSL